MPIVHRILTYIVLKLVDFGLKNVFHVTTISPSIGLNLVNDLRNYFGKKIY